MLEYNAKQFLNRDKSPVEYYFFSPKYSLSNYWCVLYGGKYSIKGI